MEQDDLGNGGGWLRAPKELLRPSAFLPPRDEVIDHLTSLTS